MKKVYSKKEIEKLLKEQISKCAMTIFKINMVGRDKDDFEKVRQTKLVKF